MNTFSASARIGFHDQPELVFTIARIRRLDPYRFNYLYQKLNNRFIGPTDEGKVLKGVLA